MNKERDLGYTERSIRNNIINIFTDTKGQFTTKTLNLIMKIIKEVAEKAYEKGQDNLSKEEYEKFFLDSLPIIDNEDKSHQTWKKAQGIQRNTCKEYIRILYSFLNNPRAQKPNFWIRLYEERLRIKRISEGLYKKFENNEYKEKKMNKLGTLQAKYHKNCRFDQRKCKSVTILNKEEYPNELKLFETEDNQWILQKFQETKKEPMTGIIWFVPLTEDKAIKVLLHTVFETKELSEDEVPKSIYVKFLMKAYPWDGGMFKK
jgi:hypothetical protein